MSKTVRIVPKGNVTLECGMRVTYDPPPFLHDIVFCPYHNDFQVVVGGTHLSNKPGSRTNYEFKAVCRQCKVTKYSFKAATAMTNAENHSTRAGHTVDIVMKNGTYLGTKSPARSKTVT